jgi:hypothetical protein
LPAGVSPLSLDARTELQLQQILAGGLAAHYEIAREVHYPPKK